MGQSVPPVTGIAPKLFRYFLAASGLAFAWPAFSCELCSIYNAASSQPDAVRGFSFSLSEMYMPSTTLQAEGKEFTIVPFLNDAYLTTSTTHLTPTYNFSKYAGVAFNVPFIYRQYHRV